MKINVVFTIFLFLFLVQSVINTTYNSNNENKIALKENKVCLMINFINKPK